MTKKVVHDKPNDAKPAVVPKKEPAWYLKLMSAIVLFGAMLAPTIPIYQKFGINIFLSSGSKQLDKSGEKWRAILPNKTIVMVGGPHRGGTTVLWDELRRHPDVANFGATSDTGVDWSEGTFLQSVYPSFGVGQEFRKMGKDRTDGLGVYGLNPIVHMTEEDPTVTLESQTSVLNSFGYFWQGKDLNGLEKPVWLEKSPPNVHLGRYMQGLFNLGLGNKHDLSAAAPSLRVPNMPPSVVRFVFISRHPIANALAHRALEECKAFSIETLVENWVSVHEYARADMPHLAFVKQLTLEAFVQAPGKHLRDIWAWLGLSVGAPSNALGNRSSSGETWSEERVAKRVRPDPNAKYRGAYCKQALASREGAQQHRALVDRFGPRVAALELGYDLDEWPCLAGTHVLAK